LTGARGNRTGLVTPRGRVTVSGLLQLPGFIACTQETVTLSGAHGTVKIAASTPTRCAGPPD
jgi:hypothetical protein